MSVPLSAHAQSRLAGLPPALVQSATTYWSAIADDGFRLEADWALDYFVRPFVDSGMPLDLGASDEEIRDYAFGVADRFCWRVGRGMGFDTLIGLAEQQGVCDWRKRFRRQLAAGRTDAVVARLQCGRWWTRFFRTALRRRCEHLMRGQYNLISNKKQLYISDEAVRHRVRQRRRNQALMETISLINELGQEFSLSEIVERSNANPAIRRAELMVRISGFETIARDCGHVGEFVTLTVPSRFHRAHYKGGSANAKYDGTDPCEAQGYLKKVWARIQAKLAREGIRIYGFRVVEPHHEGCPHWHGLFFMSPQHRSGFRRIVARHACRDSREELGLHYFDTAKAARLAAKAVQARQRQALIRSGLDARVETLAVIAARLPVEADFWDEAGQQVFDKVQKRVDFKPIDWDRGTAAGYIAKYISKNIDGRNNGGDSVGMDFEAEDGADVVETAVRVDAWSSVWGIRQFQQIGGAPVSVWRELRREGMSDGGYDDVIVRAAMAADKGDWGKFTMIMGGVDCHRLERPIGLYREDVSCCNAYGEVVDPVVRGVVNTQTGCIKISRVHEWTVQRNGGAAAAWTCVNNSTKIKSIDNIELNQIVVKIKAPKEFNREEVKKQVEAEMYALRMSSVDDPLAWAVREKEIKLLEEAARELSYPPRLSRSQVTEMIAAAKTEAALTKRLQEQQKVLQQYLSVLDSMSPPLKCGAGKVPELKSSVDFESLRTRRRRFPPPKRYETPESVLSDMKELFASVDGQLAWATVFDA